jgi:uncharacterized protein
MTRLWTLVLTLIVISTAIADAQGPPRPTLNCAKATGDIESLVCKDPALIALDRQLGDVFAAALKRWPARVAAEQRTRQRTWIADRDGCSRADDVRACVEVTYQMRIVEMQILSGQVKGVRSVEYACAGGEDRPFSATFYQETEPRSALLMFGGDRVVAFIARSASGARYTADHVDFWDRQGEATLTWFDTRLTCRPEVPQESQQDDAAMVRTGDAR